MPFQTPHRILREVVDIQCFGERDALGLRGRLEALCAGKLPAAVDQLFDLWGVPPDQLVTIDRLEISVNGLTTANLERELIARIVAALRSGLESRIGAAGRPQAETMHPLGRSVLAGIVRFLKTGSLPWTANGDSQWAEAAGGLLRAAGADAIDTLVECLQSTEARRRLARHFPAPTVATILPRLREDPTWQTFLKDAVTVIDRLTARPVPRGLRERLIGILLEAAILPGAIDHPALARAFAQAVGPVSIHDVFDFPPLALAGVEFRRAFAALEHERTGAAPRPPEVERDKRPPPRRPVRPMDHQPAAGKAVGKHDDNPEAAPDFDEAIYVRNAGLIVLAPYLPALFDRLGIAAGPAVLDIPLALVALHFLAFGTDECLEWDLVLNKILCGVPVQYAPETSPALTDDQKEECERMLDAVIANWSALKNTSADGLRETFLQREGALTFRDGSWRLVLARTAFDVLMDRLPWTISMIQLPWCPWMLLTDWAD